MGRHWGDHRKKMAAKGVYLPYEQPCLACANELFFKEEQQTLQTALGPDLAPLVPQPVTLPNHTCRRKF